MATHSSTLAWRIQWMEKPGAGYSTQGRKKSDTTEHFTFLRADKLEDKFSEACHLIIVLVYNKVQTKNIFIYLKCHFRSFKLLLQNLGISDKHTNAILDARGWCTGTTQRDGMSSGQASGLSLLRAWVGGSPQAVRGQRKKKLLILIIIYYYFCYFIFKG